MNLDHLLPMAIAGENVQRLLDGLLTQPPLDGTLAARVFREIPENRRAELIAGALRTDHGSV